MLRPRAPGFPSRRSGHSICGPQLGGQGWPGAKEGDLGDRVGTGCWGAVLQLSSSWTITTAHPSSNTSKVLQSPTQPIPRALLVSKCGDRQTTPWELPSTREGGGMGRTLVCGDDSGNSAPSMDPFPDFQVRLPPPTAAGKVGPEFLLQVLSFYLEKRF